jgi:hypothetical protein
MLATNATRSLRAARGFGRRRGEQSADALAAGAAALADWAAAEAKEYEVIAQRRDADGPMVDRALEIVRKFIVARGLILFGGLAIDYALRREGSRIYPDDQRPDFDFLSMRSVDDAYDLADLLQEAGFESVGAVRAIHVQTMKVRTDYIWVADIGYAPPDVFAQIPTFDYQGMRVVHPDYQRMDMHLAFCFPFNGPPREDVFHRWRKDLKRFNLFEKHYPIVAGDALAADGALAAATVLVKGRLAVPVKGRLAVPVIGHGAELRVALHGFAAYAVLRAALDELAAGLGRPPPEVAAPHLSLAFPDDYTIEVETPAGDTATVASPWPDLAVAGIAGAERFSPYMDVYPETYRAGGVVVLSVARRRLAASLVRVTRASAGEPCQAFVVTPQYLLLWLLFEAQRAEAGPRAVYRDYYAHTLEILQEAEGLYADALEVAEGPAEHAAVMDSFAASPFAPTLTTIGDLNFDAAYIIKMAGNAERLKDRPPAALNLDADIADLLVGLPMNYYPATSKQRPAFAYDANPLFRRSGQKIEADS